MKNYRMTIQYDGTRYNGWQRQGNTANTIQGKLEDILCRMTGHSVEIHGSGRTDKGVHALGQTANFKIDTVLESTEIMDYINRYLPEDIGVTELSEADERFHSRLCVKSKTYVYRIWNSKKHNAFEHRYMYTVEEALDINAMRTAAEYLKGKHDFAGYSSVKRNKKSTVRTLYDISVEKHGDEIRILFCGNGFLYNMVRIMAGTILEAGLGKRVPESVRRVFESLMRSDAGVTLPAKGLTLLKAEYGEEVNNG